MNLFKIFFSKLKAYTFCNLPNILHLQMNYFLHFFLNLNSNCDNTMADHTQLMIPADIQDQNECQSSEEYVKQALLSFLNKIKDKLWLKEKCHNSQFMFTFGEVGAETNGLEILGNAMFQFKIGFLTGKQSKATEQSSASDNFVSLSTVNTCLLQKMNKYL